MSKLSDCVGKAVKAGLMTEEEGAFALGRAKDFAAQGMDRQSSELGAVRSLMTDALGDLDAIRTQLGFPPRENNILFRTKNAEAANNAYVDATQRATEERLYRQQQGADVVEQAQTTAEQQLAQPRPGTAEALQFTPAGVSSQRGEQLRSLERATRLPEGSLQEVRLSDAEPAAQATRDYLTAWQALTGREVVFVSQRDGQGDGGEPAFAGAVDPAQPGRIFLHARGNRALVALAGHEWAHTLAASNPALFAEMAAKLRPLITEWEQRTGAVAAEGVYTGEEAPEELLANVIGDAFNHPEFWELVKERDRPLWQKIVEAINAWFDELIGKAAESEWGTEGFLSDLRAVHEAILDTVDADMDVARPPAMEEAAKLATQRGKGAAKELSEEHRMKLERQTRAVALKTRVSTEEKTAIAAELPNARHQQQAEADARAQRLNYPANKPAYPGDPGWKQPKVVGGELVTPRNENGEKESEPRGKARWQGSPYDFHKIPEGMTRDAYVRQLAQQSAREMLAIARDAAAGDQSAQVIMRQRGWYRNFSQIMRREFGGFGDLFADLLGTFSPGTNVHVNWIFAMDAIRQISEGKWDAQLAQLDKWIADGGTADSYKKAKMPLALQANGKKYGFNSEKGMLAALDLWRAVKKGDSVKARNFSRNLVQISFDATIDRWAARHVQRLAGQPRPPLYAEGTVDGTYGESLRATGQFGFAQDVMGEAVRILQESDPQFADLTPADYQAMQWFAEKRQWTIYDWTSEEGEGGSFESKLKKENVQRVLFGLSQEVTGRQGRPEFIPSSAQQKAFTEDVQGGLLRLPDTLAVRSKPSVGMFLATPEQSTDTEALVGPDFEPMDVIRLIAFHAGQKDQLSTFASRIIDPGEFNANATPGVEIYFKNPVGAERLDEVIAFLRNNGINGFTMVIDPRERTSATERPSRFRGIRFQYIPEFSSDGHDWTAKADAIEETLLRATKMVRAQEDVVSAQTLLYDTLVLNDTGEDYGTGGLLEASTGKERAIVWAQRFRDRAAARATGERPGGPAVDLPAVYPRGAVARGRAAKLAAQRRSGVEREAEVSAAIERITRMPTERVALLQEMAQRLGQIIRQNRLEVSGMEFARGMTVAEREQAGGIQRPEPHQIEKTRMLAAMGELNAMLKFFPPEIRGKVGGFYTMATGRATDLRLTDFLTHRVEMVGRELERMLQRDYRSQIKRMLETTKPKAINQVLRSRLGPDAQTFVDQVRAIATMSEDESAAQQATIGHELASPGLPPGRQAELERQWAIHDQFSDIGHRSAEELASAYETLSEVVQRGRFAFGVQEELRLEDQHNKAAEITTSLGVPSAAERAGARREAQQFPAMANSFGLSHYNLFQFLSSVLPEGMSFLPDWEERIRHADTGSQDMMRRGETRMMESIQRAIGSKSKAETTKALQALKTPVDTALGKMTQLEMIQYLLSYAQADVRPRMEAQGFTEEVVAQLEQLTRDPVSRAVMNFLRKEYAAAYEQINAVYKRMFGMNMPKVLFYAPTRYENAGREEEISPYGSAFSTAGTIPSFVHPRINHSAQMRQEDALTVYRQHLAQSANFIHFAEIVREMRGVLNDRDVRAGIEVANPAAGEQLTRWLDLMARQGHEKAHELIVNQWLWNNLLSGKAISTLGFNLRSLFMQIDSALRATLALPTPRVLAAMADPKFLANIPKTFFSETVQRRIENGSTPEIKYLFEQQRIRPNMMLRLAHASMMPIQWTDALFTSFTGAIVYTDAFNEGKAMGMTDAGAEAYAADKMDEAIYRYAQPTGLANRSLQEQTGGATKRMFMMYISDQRMKSALIWKAIDDLRHGRIDAATGARIFVSVMGMALVSQVMLNLYNDLFTPTDEDKLWTWQGFVQSVATVPFSGLFMVGTGMEFIAARITGQKAYVPSRDPLIDSINRMSQAFDPKKFDDYFNVGEPSKMLRQWENLARSAAVLGPVSAAPAVAINMVKPFVGAIENLTKEEKTK